MQNVVEKLFERIHTFKFNNLNLVKSYKRLTNRVYLQKGNMHAIHIMSNNETLSLLKKNHTLEVYVQIKSKKLNDTVNYMHIKKSDI